MLYQIPNNLKNNDIFFCEVDYFLSNNFKSKRNKIVVLTDDHLNTETAFLPINQGVPTRVDQIIAKTQTLPEFQFTIIHNCLNIDYRSSNCKFVHWAPEWITNIRSTKWSNVLPQTEKNFNSDYFWICLNRNKRVQRYLAAMFLLGNNLESCGFLTLTADEILEHQNFESWIYWWSYNNRNEINDIKSYFPILELGFNKIKQHIGYQQNSYSIDNKNFLDNHEENFNQFLRPLYGNSLVEVVTETIWTPDSGGIVSEKFMNSVYGYNLPIFVGVANTVKYLKELGFDLFEDVIDHSYDHCISPTMRLISALEKNKELLYNKEKAILAWKHCKSRMDHNVQISQEMEKVAEQTWIEMISDEL